MNLTKPRTVELVKGSRRFVFRYQPGDEQLIIDAMNDLARSRTPGFDQYDANFLTLEVCRMLERDQARALKHSL